MKRPTSVRLEDDLSDRLDALAAAIDRPRTWVIEQAIRSYLDEQSWQVEAISNALLDYRSGNAEIVPHEHVMAQMEERIKSRSDG